MSFKLRFKDLSRVRLSDVSREVNPEEGVMINKDPKASRLLFHSGDRQTI